MNKQNLQARRSLPIVGFNSETPLTVNEYLARAKAMTGKDVVLTPVEVRKLENSLRVFRGMVESGRQRNAQGPESPSSSVRINEMDG